MFSFDAPKEGTMEIQDWRIQMYSKSEGLWATLTINDPDVNPKKGIFLVKDYGENAGVFSWLRDNGFVRETLDIFPFAYGNMIFCKLDVKKIKEWGREKEMSL